MLTRAQPVTAGVRRRRKSSRALLVVAQLVMFGLSEAVQLPSESPPQKNTVWANVRVRRILSGLAVSVVFLGSALLLQEWVVERTLSNSLQLLQHVSAGMPQTQRESADWMPLFPFSPDMAPRGPSLAADEATEAPTAAPPRSGTPGRAGVAKPLRTRPLPQSVVASRDLVLRWAQAHLVPQGRSVPQGPGMPAGIELSGVSGLGIGLADGDRLVSVAGIPVTERSQVVSEVLAARARGSASIVVGLIRMTTRGPVPFSVTVEQPYSLGAPPAPADDASPEGQ